MEVQRAARISLKRLLRMFQMCVFKTVVGERLERGEIHYRVLIRPCDSTSPPCGLCYFIACIRPHRLVGACWLDVHNDTVNQMCAAEKPSHLTFNPN
ncbi:hypothetical protein PBY51_011435 [Eleginops maclovinus]|uniref:Uncharacterized protein n=1 Tax=Eleginops maclovinus TaxID=56733 RepID=A0AAN7XNP7_ELEMC|nr:hypothetical protein PBY51_011435 [Eleginops maclovinus]